MKQIFKIILACIFTFSSAYASIFSGSVGPIKSLQWLTQNSSVNTYSVEQVDDILFPKDELVLKVLEVIKTEAPSSKDTYAMLLNIINYEKPIVKLHEVLFLEIMNALITDEDAKNNLLNLLDSPVLPTEALPEEVGLTENGNSLSELLKSLRELMQKLPLPAQMKKKAMGTVDSIKAVFLDSIPEDDCYYTSAGCQFGSNRGLIHYFSGRIQASHQLAIAVLKLGIKISKLNIQHQERLKIAPKYQDRDVNNFWKVALDAADGNRFFAMGALSVFGHDVCCNNLEAKPGHEFLRKIINVVYYAKYGGDDNPKSVIFLPGALDGILPSTAMVKKLNQALDNYEKNFGKAASFFRLGYHHVYGGMLMTNELVKRKQGKILNVELASLISQAMGYTYKKLQMVRYLSGDANFLWKEMQFNEFSTIKSPADWEQMRFKKAKAEIELQIAILEYTEEQHYQGAQFAMKQYYLKHY